MNWFILLCMFFLHIVDDYYLQGVLAKMKQRQWWLDNAPKRMYRHDYRMALCEHAFSWTFMIMLTPMVYHIYCNDIRIWYIILYVINTIIHMYIDNLKANKYSINLIKDQSIHFIQIIITWALMDI